MNSLFHSSWTEYVTLFVNGSLILEPQCSLRVVMYALIRTTQLELLKSHRVNTIRVINRAIMFSHPHQNGPFLHKVPTGPIAYIAIPLHHHLFALEPRLEPKTLTDPLVTH